MRWVCAAIGAGAAMVALMCGLLLADDPVRWLGALPWLVVAVGVGAAAAQVWIVAGEWEPERGRVR